MFDDALYSNKDNISALITNIEFKYFEEVVDEFSNTKGEQWGEGLPPVGTKCEYSAMDSNKWWDCIFIGKVDDFIYVEAPHLECVKKFQLNHIHFRPAKSWQEVLCDELDMVYSAHDHTFNFERNTLQTELLNLQNVLLN